jgi:hypothetical protein
MPAQESDPDSLTAARRAKDRLDAEHDHEVNLEAEIEIRTLHETLDQLREQKWTALVALREEQIRLLERPGAGARVTCRAAGPIFRDDRPTFSLFHPGAPRSRGAGEAFHPHEGGLQWQRASGICWIGWR